MPEQEQPERLYEGLPPLASAIQTYVGRDEYGPLYTRLYLESEKEQLRHLPNLVRCMIDRAAQSDPHYISDRTIEFQLAKGNTTARRLISDPDTRSIYATEFVDFCSYYHADILVDQKTNIVPTRTRERYLELAQTDFKDDPLIKVAMESRRLLDNDDLGKLGKDLVCSVTAVVELLEAHKILRSRKSSSGPNVA